MLLSILQALESLSTILIPRPWRAYIQKAEVLEVRTPQIILIFRKFIVWERESSVEFCQEEQ